MIIIAISNNYLRDLNYCKHELELAQIRIDTLERDNSALNDKLFYAELRVKELENIFFAQGVTKEQIDMMIKQMQTMQTV